MSKLLLRALPNNYTFNGVYGLFGFYTPSTMRTVLDKLKIAKNYDFERPKATLPVVPVNSWDGVTQVLGDYRTFRTTYGPSMKRLTNGYG